MESSTSPRSKFLILIRNLALAFAAGLFLGDSMSIFYGVLFFSVLAFCLFILALVIHFAWYRLSRKGIQSPRENAQLGLKVFVGVALFLTGGKLKSDWEVRQAEAFVASAVRDLDKLKSKSNRYPKDLPPALARQKPAIIDYFSGGDHYVFSYMPPLSAGDTYHFDSDVRWWQKWLRNQ
jgi:hypothetical protein